MRIIGLIVLVMSLSGGRLRWTVDNEAGVKNYLLNCLSGSAQYGWDMTVAAKDTAPLYAGDIHSLATATITYGVSGAYSCTVKALDGGSALPGTKTLATSNTVKFSQ
jgi:hypothetical protein